MLEELGLGAEEERVYRTLVVTPAATAKDLGVPEDKAELLLAGLVARGLVTRAAEPGRYTVVDPGLALMAELLGRRDRLRRTELAVAELAAQHQSATRGRVSRGLVETVEGPDEIARRVAHLQLGARRENAALVTGENRTVGPADHSSEPVMPARGVRTRAVVDAAFLRQPGGTEAVEASLRAGGDVRVVDRTPMKAVITDGEVAIVPVGSGEHTALLLHGTLVDLALALFETVWQRARPYQQPNDGLNPVDTRLLHLMLAGLTDEAVAHQLELSTRSVQRRIRALMDRAGVATRIQLGWHARNHGWA